MHDFQSWHYSLADKLFQFGDPRIGTRLVGGLQVKGGVSRADVRCHLSLRYRPAVGHFDHLAVVAEADSLFLGQRPEEAVDRFVDFLAIDTVASVGISRRDRFFSEIGDVRRSRPDVTLRAYLGIREKTVEQSET